MYYNRISKTLISIFESSGTILELINVLIEQEIQNTSIFFYFTFYFISNSNS